MRPRYIIKSVLFNKIIAVHYTQENLANEINMDPSYLSKILRGRVPISTRTAYTISAALNEEVDNLFTIGYE